jgi:hypothetical protein
MTVIRQRIIYILERGLTGFPQRRPSYGTPSYLQKENSDFYLNVFKYKKLYSMSFLDTIKNSLNIGGVKIKVDTATVFSKSSGNIELILVVSSSSEKKVTEIECKLVETWRVGRGTELREREYVWGELSLNEVFTLQPNENKTVTVTLPFTPVQSSEERLAENGGILGGIGKMAMFAENSKSTFRIKISASVEGALFGASAEKQLQISQ